MNNFLTILEILLITVAVPPFVYYTVRAIRLGWLRAEQSFFTNPTDKKDE